MKRRGKAARRAAALKGWRTRRKRERLALRWGVEVLMGYQSNKGNSYYGLFHIKTYKRLKDADIFSLITRLIRQGYFDEEARDNDVADISSWFSGGVNYEEITRRNIRIKTGFATLVDFGRDSPGALP